MKNIRNSNIGRAGSDGIDGVSGKTYTSLPASSAIDNTGILIDNVDSTMTLEYADATFPGIISTTDQTFSGDKTFSNINTTTINNPGGSLSLGGTSTQLNFNNTPIINLPGSNYSIVAPITATDNNGIIIDNTANTLKLENAALTRPGIISTGTQSFGGTKTFVSVRATTDVRTNSITEQTTNAGINFNLKDIYDFTGGYQQSVLIGNGAGQQTFSNPDNIDNVFLGTWAGRFVNGAHDNIGISINALGGNNTSNYNIGLGTVSLYGLASGNGHNICLGYRSGWNIATGDHSICIGDSAGENLIAANSNNIMISNVGQVGGESNVTRIGTTQTACYIAGTITSPTISNPTFTGTVTIPSTTTLLNSTSARVTTGGATLYYYRMGNFVHFELYPEVALSTPTAADATGAIIFTSAFAVGFRPARYELQRISCSIVNGAYISGCVIAIDSDGTIGIYASNSGTQFALGELSGIAGSFTGSFALV